MNDFEQLEKELKSFLPKKPSADFERRVEDALGDSAQLAVRQLPEARDELVVQTAPATRGTPFLIPSLFMVGVAALVALFFSFPSPKSVKGPGKPMDAIDFPAPTAAQDSLSVFDDSPINGVSTEELSAMSESGWEAPRAQEFLIDFFVFLGLALEVFFELLLSRDLHYLLIESPTLTKSFVMT